MTGSGAAQRCGTEFQDEDHQCIIGLITKLSGLLIEIKRLFEDPRLPMSSSEFVVGIAGDRDCCL
jgi:hypothetical protein